MVAHSARLRPTRSATQPNTTPPSAQLTNRIEVMAPVQNTAACWAACEPRGRCSSAGMHSGATTGNNTAAKTARPQPGQPAERTSQEWPDRPKTPPRGTLSGCGSNAPPDVLLALCRPRCQPCRRILRPISVADHGIISTLRVNLPMAEAFNIEEDARTDERGFQTRATGRESARVLQGLVARRARQAAPRGRRPHRALRGESAHTVRALGGAVREHARGYALEAAGRRPVRGA